MRSLFCLSLSFSSALVFWTFLRASRLAFVSTETGASTTGDVKVHPQLCNQRTHGFLAAGCRFRIPSASRKSAI
eukprot:3915006-Amphidinium_carterae.1